jgi:uncharacterized protein (DUF2147 family)
MTLLASTGAVPRMMAPVLMALGVAGAASQAQPTPVGLWKTIDDRTSQERSLVRIVESGGVLTGTVEKRLDPDARPEDACGKCPGDRKDKPVLGLEVLRDVRRSAEAPERWDGGQILDPEEGRTYKVRLTPLDAGGRLEVRGYVGAPLFGRTQVWIRVE